MTKSETKYYNLIMVPKYFFSFNNIIIKFFNNVFEDSLSIYNLLKD